ncbi:hypothetical protein FV196_09960 [Rothia dentocariosa]|nr:hypothetical protein [Rothia dentocariosa]NLR26398.1 hypothetical protein [Rothia dentocariosa]
MEFMMAFRYSRPAMTGAAIFTLAGVTVLPLAQANAAPVSPQGEGASSASQNAQGQQAQGGATQVASDGSSQSRQQGANASQDDSNSASQNGQRQVGQPSAPVESIFVVIDSVDGFIDPQKTDNALNVRGVWYDNNPSFSYSLSVQELDESGNVVDDDVSTSAAGSSISSDGHFDLHVNVDGTKINPSHKYQVHLTAYDQGDMTTSEASYPVVIWNHTHIPVFPLSAAR